MVGRDAIVRFLLDDFPRLFAREVHVEFERLLCEGRTVVLQETMRATLANGNAYDNQYCFLFELDEHGRIDRVREYMDTLRGHRLVFGPVEREETG